MKPKDKLATVLGYFVIAVLLIGGVIGGLYWLACQFSLTVLRWVVVACVLAIPASVVITWMLATNSAREHLAGFTRGLDGAERTIQSVGRGLSATAAMARAAKGGALPVQSNDDLLPAVGRMRILDAGPNSNELLDL